jgi:PEP-CTERM motif
MKRSVFFAAMLGLVAGVSFSLAPARAAVFDWTISGGNGADGALSGSGTYTLSSTPMTNAMGTGFLVTAITGALSSHQFSSAIASANSGVVGPNGGLDDLIYPSAPGGHLVDDFGLGIALNNGFQLAIGEKNGVSGLYGVSCCGSNEPIFSYQDVTFNSKAAVSGAAAAPEPSTWAMMIAGLCGLGFMANRKKATPRFA